VLVQNRVTLALPLLPVEVQKQGITIRKKTPDILNVINFYSPDGRYDATYVSNFATLHVRDEVLRLPGVSDVTYLAERDYSIRIWLDPQKLASLNLTAIDVADAIRAQNLDAPAGVLGQQPSKGTLPFALPIDTLGRLRTPEQFGDVIVKATQGRPPPSTTAPVTPSPQSYGLPMPGQTDPLSNDALLGGSRTTPAASGSGGSGGSSSSTTAAGSGTTGGTGQTSTPSTNPTTTGSTTTQGTAGGVKLILEDRGDLGIAEMQRVADAIVSAGNDTKGLRDVSSNARADTPWLYLEIDRTKCMALCVNVSDVFNTLQVYLGSYYVNNFNLFGRTWQVNVQADPRYRDRIHDVDQLQVRNNQGQMVRLGTLMTVRDDAGPAAVMRYNTYAATAITADAAPGTSSGEAARLMKQAAERELPRSMATEWTELTYLQQQAGNAAIYVFALCGGVRVPGAGGAI
jgi:multidrug efflux pump subunit AcrB